MDDSEVDGMSAGDRGGVGALNALIKKSKVPLSIFVPQRKLFPDSYHLYYE
jgi:replication factor C subunit 1